MITLYWCVSAAMAFLAVAFFLRHSEYRRVVDGTSTSEALTRSTRLVDLATTLLIALLVSAAILTSLWSQRIATSARRRGNSGVRVPLATAGWLVPIAWWFVGFWQLRKAAEDTDARTSVLWTWQGLFIASAVFSGLARSVGNLDGASAQSNLDSLRNQWVLGVVGAVLYAICTVFASKARKELDAGVSGD